MTLVPPAGLPAPLEPLSELAVPISFSARIGGTSVAVDISFAGLAPGPVNVFQMDVRMPDSFAQGSPILAAVSTILTWTTNSPGFSNNAVPSNSKTLHRCRWPSPAT